VNSERGINNVHDLFENCGSSAKRPSILTRVLNIIINVLDCG